MADKVVRCPFCVAGDNFQAVAASTRRLVRLPKVWTQRDATYRNCPDGTDLWIPAFLIRGSPDRDLLFIETDPEAFILGCRTREDSDLSPHSVTSGAPRGIGLTGCGCNQKHSAPRRRK